MPRRRTGRMVPIPLGEDDFPVNYVSAADAEAYCVWLTERDGVNTYRLPNESEWELAAGHMPKDADFNCGVNDGRTSVEEYAKVTRGAHGAVDFWGNVWEWTTTVRSDSTLGVKGGAWDSARTDCRTEHRKEGRAASQGYKDVGFRVFKILNGEEPAQKVELATLQAPVVMAISTKPGSITLSWQAVEGATAYQLFSYDADANHIEMLGTTEETNAVMDGLAPGTYRYIRKSAGQGAPCPVRFMSVTGCLRSARRARRSRHSLQKPKLPLRGHCRSLRRRCIRRRRCPRSPHRRWAARYIVRSALCSGLRDPFLLQLRPEQDAEGQAEVGVFEVAAEQLRDVGEAI